MKQKIYSEGTEKISFRSFPGLDLRYPLDGRRGATEVDNFRIGEDGSLIGRCGFGNVSSLSANAVSISDTDSGLWVCTENGKIYPIDRSDGSVPPDEDYEGGDEEGGVTSVVCSDSDIGITDFGDRLIIGDGTSVKIYDKATGELRELNGYAPLIGKLWDPNNAGQRFEPENIASNRVRISYLISTPTFKLYTGGVWPTSIDYIEANDEALDMSEIEFNKSNCAIEGPDGCFPEGIVTVWLTMRAAPQQYMFAAARHFSVADLNNGQKLLFAYGLKTATGYKYPYVFRSREIADPDFYETERVYYEADRVYFPMSDRLSAGTGGHPITAVCPLDDRVLVFSDCETFSMPLISSYIPTPKMVDQSSGCANAFSFMKLGGSIVTASSDGVFVRTPGNTSYDDIKSECLSFRLGDKKVFPSDSEMSLYYSKPTDELFVVGTGFKGGKTAVCNMTSGCWYTYSGFSPRFMMYCAGMNCFISGAKIFGFSESRVYDVSPTSSAPVAVSREYRSALLPVADPGKVRRPSRIGLTAAIENGTATLSLLDAAGNTLSSHNLTGSPSLPYSSFSVRPSRKRGSFFAFSFSTSSGTPARIFDLMFEAGD